MVKSAEAEAESKFLQGQGLARQRQAIVSGLRDSVKAFGEQVGGDMYSWLPCPTHAQCEHPHTANPSCLYPSACSSFRLGSLAATHSVFRVV